MNLIQRYLFRHILFQVVAACAALAGIGILSQSLDQLQVIVERGQSVWIMVKLTLLALPQLLAVILPIGLFVGALIALTRLQREQELTASFAGGMTRWQVISPAARIAVLVALVTLLVNVFLLPWAQQEARRQAFDIRTDLAALLVEEGQFVQGPDGLTVYVQQIEQNGLLKNLFVYLDDKDKVTTWNAAEARFSRDAAGTPVLTMIDGSAQRYSSGGVLETLSFGRYDFSLAPFVGVTDTLRFKPTDLYLRQLLNPTAKIVEVAGTRGELLAEAHSRLSSPLYALVAMALALSAILGGSFSRTGYTLRIAKAAGLFLLLRVIGYGLVAGSAWNGSLNVLQYVVPIVAVAVSLRVLFRALKPRRSRSARVLRDLKARFA